jgi:hypothetical protein
MKIIKNNQRTTITVGSSLAGYQMDTIELTHADLSKLLSMEEVNRYRYLEALMFRMRSYEKPTMKDKIKKFLRLRF